MRSTAFCFVSAALLVAQKLEAQSIYQLESDCLGQNEDCCTPETPCPSGYGDCDSGHDCQAGLACGEDNCDASIVPYGTPHEFSGSDDCCAPRYLCDGETEINCCTKNQPCDEDEGDCDYDSQCRGTLVCGNDNCEQENLKGYDCCQTFDLKEGNSAYSNSGLNNNGGLGIWGKNI